MKNRLNVPALVTLAAIGIIGTGAAASAADIPVKAPPYKPPYSWSGCYLGATVGWGAANDWRVTDLGGFNPGGVNPWSYSSDGLLAGGTAGCNWQPAGMPLVFSVEGEGGYLHITGPGPQLFGAATVADVSKIGTGYGMVGGRVGWAFLERILVYGKVGVAFYDTSSTVTSLFPVGFTATGSASQSPLAFGGGVEYAFDAHWSGKAEAFRARQLLLGLRPDFLLEGRPVLCRHLQSRAELQVLVGRVLSRNKANGAAAYAGGAVFYRGMKVGPTGRTVRLL
jgi:outer membrane immunogenic protein